MAELIAHLLAECEVSHLWAVSHHGVAAMLAIKRSAVVTLEVNLRNSMQVRKQAIERSKKRLSAAPRKGDMSSKIKKKQQLKNQNRRYKLTIRGNFHLQLVLKAGLYHGNNNLCPLMSTSQLPLEDGWIDWCESLEFEMSLENIPRATKLCFALYVVFDQQMVKQAKSKSATAPRKIKQGKQVSII